ncbi:hypothetical protein OAP65_03750 [Litorivicinus sp.]|nr:hypothetical protein [Litorivicinus sp.]
MITHLVRIKGLWINGVEKVITLKNNGFLECFGAMKRGYPQNRAKTFKALYFNALLNFY